MNNQEIFDTVATHIIKQGKPSVNASGRCMYRGEDDTMCAVGALIPDEVYHDDIEDLLPNELIENGYITNVKENRGNLLLTDLQSAHDSDLLDYDDESNIVPNFDMWVAAMHYTAKKYNLNTNVLYDALKEAGHNVSN